MQPHQFLGKPLLKHLEIYIVFVILFICISLYTVFISSLDDQKLTLVFLIFPIFVGVAILRQAPKILLALLVISLSFSARFRPTGLDFHPGGAELAIAPLDFTLFLLVIIMLLQILRGPHGTKPSIKPLFWPLLLFIISHVLSIIPATSHSLAILELLRLLKMVLLVLVVSHFLNSQEKIEFVVNILMLMVILQGILAVIQSVFQASLGLDFLGERQFWTISERGIILGRAGGTLGHANVLANFFELLTPIGFALILSSTTGYSRLLACSALLAGIIGTFLTFSRAGWVSLVLGLSLVIFLHLKYFLRAKTIATLLVIALVVGVIGLCCQDIIVARFTVFWKNSMLVRTVTAETALNMLHAHPILGVGANNYLHVSHGYAELPIDSGRLSRMPTAVVHNIVLLYGAELGLLGLSAFIVLLLSLVHLSHRITHWGAPFSASLSTGILAGIIALMAHGMWDWLFRYDPIYTLFWFNVGLLVATRKVFLKETSHE